MVFLFGLTTEKFVGGETFDLRVLVATFESRELAQKYILQSVRRKPSNEPIRKSIQQPYHSASVLGAFTDYEIVDFEEIPYNPEKNW